MKRNLNEATPDELIEQGQLRAALYEIDLSLTTPESAPFLVTYLYGRVGAVYPSLPDHAHYVNLYVSSGLEDGVRKAVFPEVLGAAHSVAVHEGTPPRGFTRAHGIMLGMTSAAASEFFRGAPASAEMFEVGPTDRPVEMYGVTVKLDEASALESYVSAHGERLLWLTPTTR